MTYRFESLQTESFVDWNKWSVQRASPVGEVGGAGLVRMLAVNLGHALRGKLWIWKSNWMPSLPVRSVDLPGLSKCRLIPQWSYINAPVVVRSCVRRKEAGVVVTGFWKEQASCCFFASPCHDWQIRTHALR